MWQYNEGTGRPSKQIDEVNSSLDHFLACPPTGLTAFAQIISQWPAGETQNTNSSICKPHPTQHCLCFLAAVRQLHDNRDQRPHCGQRKACAGSDVQAGQQVGKAHTAFDPFCMCLLGFGAAHAAALPSGSTVLGQVCCP